MYRYFESIFANMQMPVLVCACMEDYPLVYLNTGAQILLRPQLSAIVNEQESVSRLAQLLRFETESLLEDILSAVASVGSVREYPAVLFNFEQSLVAVTVTANLVQMQDEQYIVFYIQQEDHDTIWDKKDSSNVMNHIFQVAYHSNDMNDAIDKVLRLAGSFAGVSRAYVFEDVSGEVTRNTYEWCDKDIQPFIHNLQSIQKAEAPHDAIIKGGVFVVDDMRMVPGGELEKLREQGIRSMAVVVMRHHGQLLGYVGFDDCRRYRKWTGFEIEILQTISGVITSLILRRRAEEKAVRMLDIMQEITDHTGDLIYVNNADTMELVFCNRAIAGSQHMKSEEMVGEICWQVLHKNQRGQCSFCPMRKMIGQNGNVLLESYSWELPDDESEKWYLVKDSIVNWLDGQRVHIQTATEITYQKQYEKRLEYFASTDALTGLYNREWGYKRMLEAASAPLFLRQGMSLCFIDIDGLKKTNDTYGHEAGDDMILRIVDIIRASTRRSDVLFRWGGDEFILLLQCDKETAEKVMLGIQRKMDEYNATGEKPYKLAFSYGVTDFKAVHEDSIDATVAIADKRMYENKLAKRKRNE